MFLNTQSERLGATRLCSNWGGGALGQSLRIKYFCEFESQGLLNNFFYYKPSANIYYF